MSRRASPFTWNRPHLIAWAGFLAGAGVSITANVADANPGTGSRLFGAFWPAALLLALEVITRERWAPGRARAWARYLGTGTVATVAALISYGHLSNLLARYGENPLYAHIGPFAIDGLMVICATAMLPSAAERAAEATAPRPAATRPVPTPRPVTPRPAKPVTPKRAGKPIDLARIGDLLEPTRQLLGEWEGRGEHLSGTKLQAALKARGHGCSQVRRNLVRAYLYSLQADPNWQDRTEHTQYVSGSNKKPTPPLNGVRVGTGGS